MRIGQEAASVPIAQQDLEWSRCSSDKPDIGRSLVGALRSLFHTTPPAATLRAVSIGSSSEPQLRVFTAACTGGVWLLDVDADALDVAAERARRQHVDGLHTVVADLTDALADRRRAAQLRRDHLDGHRMNVVAFHHSLYYAPRASWDSIFDATYHELVAGPRRQGAAGLIHAVLMASRTDDPYTTTAIYDRWAGKFFGAHNDQDLAAFGRRLRRSGVLPGATLRGTTSDVVFDSDDFRAFMSVIWMILLHPMVHEFGAAQQEEVTEWVYRELWSQGRPLVQRQDHLTVLRGG